MLKKILFGSILLGLVFGLYIESNTRGLTPVISKEQKYVQVGFNNLELTPEGASSAGFMQVTFGDAGQVNVVRFHLDESSAKKIGSATINYYINNTVPLTSNTLSEGADSSDVYSNKFQFKIANFSTATINITGDVFMELR